MFAGKAGAYPSEAPTFQVLPSRVGSWSHPETLDWKGLPGTKTLGYYENP
jgi:hypothetical protein